MSTPDEMLSEVLKGIDDWERAEGFSREHDAAERATSAMAALHYHLRHGGRLPAAWADAQRSTESLTWGEAVRRFSCPFCGRPKGRRCGPVIDGGMRDDRPDLVKPHEPRLALLTETDRHVIARFS